MSVRAEVRRRSTSGPRRRRALAEAICCLALARLALRFLPFERVGALLRLAETAPDLARAGTEPVAEPDETARTVGWAVKSAAGHAPWTSSCLTQSLAGYVMLRRRHLTGEVWLGVSKDGDGQLIAHSWLSSGGAVLTGDHASESFSPIAMYVDGHRRRGGV